MSIQIGFPLIYPERDTKKVDAVWIATQASTTTPSTLFWNNNPMECNGDLQRVLEWMGRRHLYFKSDGPAPQDDLGRLSIQDRSYSLALVMAKYFNLPDKGKQILLSGKVSLDGQYRPEPLAVLKPFAEERDARVGGHRELDFLREKARFASAEKIALLLLHSDVRMLLPPGNEPVEFGPASTLGAGG